MAKLLVVEDDMMNREMLTRRLTWEGHTVITANNGALGVSMALQEQPDLILMDMGLPVLNGWQATNRIKNNAATAHIPVIALTAYALVEDRQKSFEAGCDDYESKPVDFPRLLDKIAALINAAARQRGAG